MTSNPMNCMSEIGKPLQVDPRIASLLAENERLRAALRDYGQHQQKSCLDLPATETQFCYCGLTAALAGSSVETTARHYMVRGRFLPLSENGVLMVGLDPMPESTHEVVIVDSPEKKSGESP